jgi:hypothetical protein
MSLKLQQLDLLLINFNIKLQLLNERIIELIDIVKNFGALKTLILKLLKILPKA